MSLKVQLKGKNKKCGLLLSVTSLPSNYGIGSLGEEAYKFIDFLKETKDLMAFYVRFSKPFLNFARIT